jgi:hypothetical protein
VAADGSAADLGRDVGTLSRLVDSWELSLRAGNEAPRTLETYLDSAYQLVGFLDAAGMPSAAAAIRREHVEALLADLAVKRKPSTVSVRFRAAAAVPLARRRGRDQRLSDGSDVAAHSF